MLNVTCLRLTALIYIVHPCGLIVQTIAYNTSLRRFMGLPWHNSASEMFVNLNINYLVNCFEFLYTDFVQGLLYLEILCCPGFALVHVVFIRSYGLGGEHYSMFICD